MKMRYDIQPDDIGDFRSTTIYDVVEDLDPDGFTCDEQAGDEIIARYGWGATKTPVEILVKTPAAGMNHQWRKTREYVTSIGGRPIGKDEVWTCILCGARKSRGPAITTAGKWVMRWQNRVPGPCAGRMESQ